MDTEASCIAYLCTAKLKNKKYMKRSVAAENVACIDLVLNIVEASIIAVGNDGLALCLELVDIVDHLASEEAAAIFECWLVDYDLSALGLDTLHDALDSRLTEIVGIGLDLSHILFHRDSGCRAGWHIRCYGPLSRNTAGNSQR